jgi:hypothetical protein
MLASIQQYVAQSTVHLAWRRQHSNVIAIREHTTTTVRHTIHGPRQTGSHRLHAAPERMPVLCLDDEVRMIALERVVREPEPLPLTPGSEGTLDRADDTDGA